MTQRITLLVLPLLLLGCHSTAVQTPPAETTPTNVILIIGDGLGVTHLTVMDHLRGEASTLPRFSHSAIVTTHSASSSVTDSGASATAMAAGIKTTNGALSVMPDGTPVETALEIAEKNGMKTGLVTTSDFWDATTAAFAAHTLERDESGPIIPQILSSGVDLVISNHIEKLAREGHPSLTELAETYGYEPVLTAEQLVPTQAKVLAMFPLTGHDAEYPDAPLPVLMRYAIDHLSDDPDGFLLVIESEATDSESHDNDTDAVLESLASLDTAVEVALDFAASDGNTIVILVGDHETGGFQIVRPEGSDLNLEWHYGRHTGQAVPLLAYGPGAERFRGWIDNTFIGTYLKEIVATRARP